MKKSFLLLCAVAVCTSALAEGYQVNNMSARQAGMGHTGTAMHLNSESVFFNPAATAFQSSRFDVSAGMTGIISNVHYQSLPTLENGYVSGKAEKSENFATPLHVYFNYKPSERWAVGLGFYTPDGSSVDWGDNWSGAHLVQNISLAAYTVQPTVSFKICDRLSIGAGLTITWGNFDLSRSMLSPKTREGIVKKLDVNIDALNEAFNGVPTEYIPADKLALLQQLQGAKTYLNGTMDRTLVSARLKGSADVAVGVNAGILFDVNDEWRIGMTWRSRVDMKVGRGTASMTMEPQAAALLAQLGAVMGGGSLLPALDQGTFRAQLPLPTTVTWGVSFRPRSKWEIAADLQWVGWSAYKALNVVFNEPELGIEPIYSVKNYSNTLAFRVGGQYRATDFLTLRMGMYVDESPVSSDYLNPETPSMTKVSYTAGLTLRPAKCMTVDLAYCFVSAADPERTGSYPIYDTAGNLTDVFSGNYKLHANVFSVGIGLHF
ncbi:MAG: outer membrane protein transport protein [Alistipes senegalensis]|nr:outer membrane protein transport protein [Bacteroides cellulosilyticus]MCM1351941.1 outer membrane protein transport protein [Alistipes senegalensis]